MRQFVLAFILVFATASCVPVLVQDKGPGHGPPPHAPAHGRRAKHGGADLEFDTGVGVYIVLGHPGFYFLEDRYYRIIDDVWHISVGLNGPWSVVGYEKVPPGLVKKQGKGKAKGKGKGKGKG